jgi:hypothetical protein
MAIGCCIPHCRQGPPLTWPPALLHTPLLSHAPNTAHIMMGNTILSPEVVQGCEMVPTADQRSKLLQHYAHDTQVTVLVASSVLKSFNSIVHLRSRLHLPSSFPPLPGWSHRASRKGQPA